MGLDDNSSVRWHQRLAQFERALDRLNDAVLLSKTRPLSELEKQGLIQSFEFTHELAWNVFKDYLVYQGVTQVAGPRDATREAFAIGLITDGEGWMQMIFSRNKTSHTYNETIANEIAARIIETYLDLFITVRDRLRDARANA